MGTMAAQAVGNMMPGAQQYEDEDSNYIAQMNKRQQQSGQITDTASNLLMSTGNPIGVGIGAGLMLGSKADAAIQKKLKDEEGFYKSDSARFWGKASENILNPVAAISNQIDFLGNKDYSLSDKLFHGNRVQKEMEQKAKEELRLKKQAKANELANSLSAGQFGESIMSQSFQPGGRILYPQRAIPLSAQQIANNVERGKAMVQARNLSYLRNAANIASLARGIPEPISQGIGWGGAVISAGLNAKDAYNAYQKGDYMEAANQAAQAGLEVIPGGTAAFRTAENVIPKVVGEGMAMYNDYKQGQNEMEAARHKRENGGRILFPHRIFKGGGVTTPVTKPIAKPLNIAATAQDSMDLYNSAKAVQDYYTNKNTFAKGIYSQGTTLGTNNQTQANIFENLDWGAQTAKDRAAAGETTRISEAGKVTDRVMAPEEYRTDIDKNRFTQREVQQRIIDKDSPAPLYDRRIKPQLDVSYKGLTGPMKGDEVQMYGYDPIAVKPWHSMSTVEQKLRVAKYGFPPGITAIVEKPALEQMTGRGTSIQPTVAPVVNPVVAPIPMQRAPVQTQPTTTPVPEKATRRNTDPFQRNVLNEVMTDRGHYVQKKVKVLSNREKAAAAKHENGGRILYAKGGGIHIKKSHKGLFTAKAKAAGMSVQAFARHVLANKEKYSAATVKQANFARNASKWKHEEGGVIQKLSSGGRILFPSRILSKELPQKTIVNYKRGGAIILGGKRHEDESLTDLGKGNPIMDTEGKVAETEVGELLLSLQQTKRIMELYNQAKREPGNAKTLLTELGREMRDIVMTETIDKSGEYNL